MDMRYEQFCVADPFFHDTPVRRADETSFAAATGELSLGWSRSNHDNDQPSALRFRLLGPLEVTQAGRTCTPSAQKQRALLGLLLMHSNQFLSADLIVDALWSGRPPKSALPALQGYVSAIRRTLIPQHTTSWNARHHSLLRTRPAGYLLSVLPGQLDVEEFRRLAAAGRRQLGAASWERAGDLLRSALDLWRGAPLADLGPDMVKRYADRLDEERLAVAENWLDTQLRLGKGLCVVAELTELCGRHPLRERFHQQLMLALYVCGRRADALHAYTRTYRLLVDEIGIEPGQQLRDLHQAILDERRPSTVAALALAGHTVS
jgi:DNA-binding SARP family transcriptional activator